MVVPVWVLLVHCLLLFSLLIFSYFSCQSTPLTVQASSSQSYGSLIPRLIYLMQRGNWQSLHQRYFCSSSYCTHPCKCWKNIKFPFLNACSQEAACFTCFNSSCCCGMAKVGWPVAEGFRLPWLMIWKVTLWSSHLFKAKVFLPLYDSKHLYSVITFYVALLTSSLTTPIMPSHWLC